MHGHDKSSVARINYLLILVEYRIAGKFALLIANNINSLMTSFV